MKPMAYVTVTLSGKRERYFVGRVSVDGKSIITEFEVNTQHVANVTVGRLNYALETQGGMEGPGMGAPSPTPTPANKRA